jgi:hypothetical protein
MAMGLRDRIRAANARAAEVKAEGKAQRAVKADELRDRSAKLTEQLHDDLASIRYRGQSERAAIRAAVEEAREREAQSDG